MYICIYMRIYVTGNCRREQAVEVTFGGNLPQKLPPALGSPWGFRHRPPVES